MRTDSVTLREGPADSRGYRRLSPGPGEAPALRSDLHSGTDSGQPLLAVAQLSDLHLCDAQSPARLEMLDRWADPDSPLLAELGEVGTYRAQELLTAQVAEAAVQSVNALPDVDLALVTGDVTDNAQANELAWYLGVLQGAVICPDSGDRSRWEGVADGHDPDERFWHPHGDSPDLPRSRYGLPVVPGLLDAARAPFRATGLTVPWLAVHGNHDRMLQGTVPATGALARASVGSSKPVAVPADWSPDAVLSLLRGLERCDPQALAALPAQVMRQVTADPARRTVTRAEFVQAHFGAAARPPGHGFDPAARETGRAYYRHDHDRTVLLVLDTVNEHGGWQGSVDEVQLGWLDSELTAADRDRRYVILASHHPLHTLVNDRTGSERRVLAAELAAVLDRHPSVVLWLNGHTHRCAVTAHRQFWEVTTPSLIDWPQQSRLMRVSRSERGHLMISSTMVDHAGPAGWTGTPRSPVELAGLSRELAANDWQWRGHQPGSHPRAGRRADRNVLLPLPDPWRR